jgi:hypothetical protein
VEAFLGSRWRRRSVSGADFSWSASARASQFSGDASRTRLDLRLCEATQVSGQSPLHQDGHELSESNVVESPELGFGCLSNPRGLVCVIELVSQPCL